MFLSIQGKRGGEIMRRKAFVLLPISLFFLFVFIVASSVRSEEGYVGSEVCKECHEAQYNDFIKSIHGKKAITYSPANSEGCESCHGPGAQHVEKGGGKGVAIFAFGKKVDAREKASKCFACHGETKNLAFWDSSRHKSADVSCDNCHSIHTVGGNRWSKVQTSEACFECHRNIRAQTNKQSHHPIREGRIKCNDCHNPHGSLNAKAMIKADSVNDLCYQCHAEKRGPYAFEHTPVPENCLTCHEIHGSNHGKLLVRKVPLLCQSCHNAPAHPSQPYTNLHSFSGPATSSKNRFFGRSCLNCHGNIHGSSLSEFFVR
jgi:DmsE family decaheme c-type cytochrome